MITIEANRIVKKCDNELLIIKPWGQHSLRVRSFLDQYLAERGNTLTELHGYNEKLVEIYYKNNQVTIVNGRMRAVPNHRDRLTFCNEKDEVLLEEFIHLRIVKRDDSSEDVGTVEFTKDFNSTLKLKSREYHANNDRSSF